MNTSSTANLSVASDGIKSNQPGGVTFREACCNRLGIPQDAFEKRVLLECLPRGYRWVGHLRWYVNRSYFKPDLVLIRAVADCTSVNQIILKMNYLHKTGFLRQRFGRRVLRFRLSGRRLICLARQFLP